MVEAEDSVRSEIVIVIILILGVRIVPQSLYMGPLLGLVVLPNLVRSILFTLVASRGLPAESMMRSHLGQDGRVCPSDPHSQQRPLFQINFSLLPFLAGDALLADGALRIGGRAPGDSFAAKAFIILAKSYTVGATGATWDEAGLDACWTFWSAGCSVRAWA